MNPLFARFFRLVYRKEPISGFILILGGTDALIGGLGGQGGLLSMGLLVAMLGVGMRWKQGEKKKAIATEPVRYLLPPGQSRQPLPLLMPTKRKK